MRDVIRMRIPRLRSDLVVTVLAVEAIFIAGLHLFVDELSMTALLALAASQLGGVLLVMRAFDVAAHDVGASGISWRELGEAFVLTAAATAAGVLGGGQPLPSSAVSQILLFAAVEELVWRGVLLPQTTSLFSKWLSKGNAVLAAIGAVSILFAASHVAANVSLANVLGIACGGALSSALYAATSRIWVPFVMHAAHNALVVSLGPSWLSLTAQAVGIVLLCFRLALPDNRNSND